MCPSEARDWHTTLSKGVRIRCPLFFRPALRICESAVWCVFGCAWGTVVDPASGYSVSSGKQRNRQTPKAHGRSGVVVCVSTYSAMPVRADITVGSVDSNRYSRCTACQGARCEIHAAFKFSWFYNLCQLQVHSVNRFTDKFWQINLKLSL